MCEWFGIKRLVTTAESPSSNGQCEKMIGHLKDFLRKMWDDGHNSYVSLLTWSVANKSSLLE